MTSTPSAQVESGKFPPKSAWSSGIASLAFSGATIFLFDLYSQLHWTVLAKHYQELESTPELKHALFALLGRLEYYRLFGVFAVVWAVWALRSRPSWVGWIAVSVALFAVFLAIAVQ